MGLLKLLGRSVSKRAMEFHYGHPEYLQIPLHGRLYMVLRYHARSRKPCNSRTCWQ